MKTRIITFATLIILFVSTLSAAGNYRSIKIFNQYGCCSINILSKVEEIEETFDFSTEQVFHEVIAERNKFELDIVPFIKPEAEVEETLPIAIL